MGADVFSAFRPLPRLKTSRLILRRAYVSDTDDIFVCMGNPKISEYETWDVHKSNVDTLSYINNLIMKYEKRSASEWIIERQSDGRAIGMINLHDIAAKSRRCEIGYWIAEDCWHQGYATEAIRRIFDFAFCTAGFHKIIGKCVSDNIASENLMRKVGMSYEGILRQDVVVNGKFVDLKQFSILENDWEKSDIPQRFRLFNR